jgi:hypothetical protein
MGGKDFLNGAKRGLASAVGRANMAIVVSAVCVLGGLAYAIWTNNTDLVTFIAGARARARDASIVNLPS